MVYPDPGRINQTRRIRMTMSSMSHGERPRQKEWRLLCLLAIATLLTVWTAASAAVASHAMASSRAYGDVAWLAGIASLGCLCLWLIHHYGDHIDIKTNEFVAEFLLIRNLKNKSKFQTSRYAGETMFRPSRELSTHFDIKEDSLAQFSVDGAPLLHVRGLIAPVRAADAACEISSRHRNRYA